MTGPNRTTNNFGTVSFAGAISGAGSIVLGGGFVQSDVLLASALSSYSGGTTLSFGALGIGASTVGATGPIGTGSLTISNSVQVNNGFTLSGGTLVKGTILQTTNGQDILVSSGTLDGVTVNGDLDVGSTVSGANLFVLNGLTLNGTMRVGNPTNNGTGALSFAGTQTLGGNGTVILGYNPCNTVRLLSRAVMR